MERWRKRALAYRVLSKVPGGGRILDSYRKRYGNLRAFDPASRLPAVAKMVEMLDSTSKTVAGKDMIEIGAGWHPVLPAVFHAMGARSIIMTDVAAHMDARLVAETVGRLLEISDQVGPVVGVSPEVMRDRLAQLVPGSRPWRDRWRERGLIYRAPHDFGGSDQPEQSADVIYSNSTLGYIPTAEVERIFAKSRQLLRAGGWIMHTVSTYDDYAMNDPNITPLNDLQFEADEWERIGNSKLHYQNRQRPRYYVELSERHGMRVVHQERRSEHISADMLESVVIHTDFQDCTEEDLLCAHLTLVAEVP